MTTDQFSGKLALQQRVLPAYRTPFFDLLAKACTGGLSVFAGQPQPDENISTAQEMQEAQYVQAKNWHFFNVQSPFYRCYQQGILHWLEEWQPDALIVEANPRYLSTPRAVRWMHARGNPVLGWGLGAPPVIGSLASWRIQSREKFLHSLDGVIAYSQRGAQEYCQAGIPAERVFVAPNASASRPQYPIPERPPEFQDAPKVLFVGRLQRRKQIDQLFLACELLPDAIKPSLRIVGDGPEREYFERCASEHYPEAVFLGALYGKALADEFRRADLFVLPGTGGLAVQQAMAYGLPVIVAEGDGTQGDLVRQENGWQTANNDVEALRAVLMEALSNPARLRQMGVESYRIVCEEINLERMVGEFVNALNSLIR